VLSQPSTVSDDLVVRGVRLPLTSGALGMLLTFDRLPVGVRGRALGRANPLMRAGAIRKRAWGFLKDRHLIAPSPWGGWMLTAKGYEVLCAAAFYEGFTVGPRGVWMEGHVRTRR
jgi:hypothetical protein